MNLNQLVAEINGYEYLEEKKCWYKDGDFIYDFDMPDYLSPENFHELMRVGVEMKPDNIEIEQLAEEWRVCLTKGMAASGYHFTKDTPPSDALANAMVGLKKAIKETA